MSLFYNVLFASKCRSNHHRLALDALRWLDGDNAERWRNLFLHHHQAYFEGAKAPDEVFKDFKNHVLHVRDNYWGGAVEAAEEWYRRTVRALAAGDWKLGVYSAGVMSHYVVDPIQPFHTGQTEEEGVIHRAVEQSLSKAYEGLQRVLEEDLGGYPTIELPSGEDWLAQTVRMGAEAANPHYETLIDHYDFARGVKKPLEGLDAAINTAIAPLIGRAAVTLARIYERAFEEAAATPPNTMLVMDTLFATLAVPINSVVNKMADGKDAALVKAMYAEFQKSGKVRATLPEDDKEVRALYAMEVLKTPLSTLNAKWPREIGLAHGDGDPAAAPKPQPKPKPAAKPAPQPALKTEKPAPTPQPAERPAPEPAPVMANNDPRLHRDDPIVDAPSIGAKTAARLEAVGLKTVADLLDAEPDHAAKSVKASHITPPVIRTWQAQAMLACAIPSLRGFDAQVLVGAGIRDFDQLAAQTPQGLANAIALYLKTNEGKQLARSSKPATMEAITIWIETARKVSKAAA
jgi:predicted flap endonuclease-1-like 5' DNA nuclease